MLRAVRLNNFVKFHNDCMFSFRDDGAYFFVGENGSGKSSVLEAIRRCLSRDANTSFSRIPDESKPSYIICEYEMPDRSLLNDCKKVFTSFLYIPDTTSTYKYAKIVLLVEKEEVFIEFIKRENDAYGMQNCTCSSQDEEEHNITKRICQYIPLCTKDSGSSDNNITTLLAFLKEVLDAKREDTGTNETADKISEMENVLSTLENSLVFTFGQRSLGPLQWSKSKLIATSEREQNYKTAREKCEIINYFLSKPTNYDSQKEGEIFNFLTNQANCSFYLKEDGMVAVDLDGKGVEVLKLSEGILEAKYVSLLLASKHFYTVLLEEPDRGMHPQMIKIIRDIVLRQIKDKTIIIVSHNPGLISSWSIPRTYKFYQERDKDKLISRMVFVGRVAQKGKNKIPRLLASEDYVSMLFARNVIFVEGQSDFFFVKAIIEHITTTSNDKSTQRVLQLALSEETTNTFLKTFRIFLASLYVVKLSGEKSKHKWKYVSRELGLFGFFILDRDAVVQVQIVDTSNLAAETVKRDIEKFVMDAIQKQSKVKSQNTQQIHKSENTQDQLEMKKDGIETGLQQSLTEAVKPKQGNPDLAKLKTVTESMTYKFWNQTDTVNEGTTDEHMESISLETARENMKEVVKEIVSSSTSGKDLDEILNEDVRTRYLQYFRSIYKDLLDKNSGETPLSTILFQPKMEDGLVSQDLKSRYVDFVKNDKWPEARQCLEEEGVFVWKSGNLEDVFTDIVKNFEWADESTRNVEMLRRYMEFSRLGIDLKITKPSTGKQTKLFMDDKVSDENIRESIVSAFNLCGKTSDITKLVLFLVRAQSRVQQ
ncbi:hypothetical protein ACJMK2_036838 [Sinanodonta woodiana]|uniref:Endonuclease GajA/Old nuclease/RecF-like AAA domain-containing protein n=1 Tax=Sinanodonta woodiana TaxID=1069815 RepID=A0ABD3WIG9_SINWO